MFLFETTEKNEPASKYWSFSLAVEHGFIDTNYPHDACIHPPATDWANPLQGDGDANLAAAPEEESTPGGEQATAVGVDLAVRFFSVLFFSANLFYSSSVCMFVVCVYSSMFTPKQTLSTAFFFFIPVPRVDDLSSLVLVLCGLVSLFPKSSTDRTPPPPRLMRDRRKAFPPFVPLVYTVPYTGDTRYHTPRTDFDSFITPQEDECPCRRL